MWLCSCGFSPSAKSWQDAVALNLFQINGAEAGEKKWTAMSTAGSKRKLFKNHLNVFMSKT